MNKIVIINIYFGQFPNWFDLWIASCKSNPTIDFLLVTDNKLIDLPQNVKIINMNLVGFSDRVKKTIRHDAVVDRPYKVCDYRPMFGLIFSGELSQYDYWGHCDSDMIFGDLQCFFDKYDLYQYDKFLHFGHLSLYRNTKEINNAFRLDGSSCGNWEYVITNPNNCIFDEQDGIYQIYLNNGLKVFDKRIFADISSVYKRFRLTKRDVNYKHQVFYVDKGKCYRCFWNNGEKKQEEFIYIHIQKRKFETPNFNVNTTDSYYVTPYGFFPKTGEVTMKDINKYNPYRGLLSEKLIWAKYRYKDVLKAFLVKIGLFH